uniref:Uncharacterized protein n=1 Tax=Arundo donax TaxID=35708 RepID=A0A0A9HQZ3_ARUDO
MNIFNSYSMACPRSITIYAFIVYNYLFNKISICNCSVPVSVTTS